MKFVGLDISSLTMVEFYWRVIVFQGLPWAMAHWIFLNPRYNLII